MMRARGVIVGAVLAGWASHLAPAVAAPTLAEERAQRLGAEAVGLFDERRYAEAATLFWRAFQIYPAPKYLYNAARATEVSGEMVRGLELYERYLALTPRPADAAEVQARASELATLLGRTHGRVEIVSTPPGGFISIDGQPTAPPRVTPATLWLPEGGRLVRVEASGHEAAESQVQLGAGALLRLELALPAVEFYGRLNVQANVEGAHLYIDNAYAGVTPLDLPRVREGHHALRLEKEGYDRWVGAVDVRRGETATSRAALVLIAEAPPTAGASVQRDAGWGVFAAGVALLGAGAVCYGVAWDQNDLYNRRLDPRDATSLADARTTGQSLEAAAWAGWGVGLAAAGAGLILALTAPEGGEASSRVEVGATVGPGALGVQVGSRF